MSDSEESHRVTFKKSRKQHFRKRRQPSESESDNEEQNSLRSVLDDVQQLHKTRQKSHGVSAESLAVGKQVTKEEKAEHDPLKLKSGGYVELKDIKHKLTTEDMEQIGTSFAAETNRRDEDAEMVKYVEQEMKKRKGIDTDDRKTNSSTSRDAELYELPEHIRSVSAKYKKTEAMLSNQMLSGIPEVDLGIEAKISNIEKTEQAKQDMIAARRNKQDEGLLFVPTNMAVNFVQHKRFKIEEDPKVARKVPVPEVAPVVRVGDTEKSALEMESNDKKKNRPVDKATDDFHFEKFKKQMRRF